MPNLNAALLRSAPWPRVKTFLAGLSDDEARVLLGHWPLWARPDQLPPPGGWVTWLVLGGRGAGKTRTGAEWVRMLVRSRPPPGGIWRIALVGETYLQAREVMVEGPSGLLASCADPVRPRFQASRRRLVWPRRAEARLFSSEDPQGLRGPQFHFAWCDELAKWRHVDETWDMLQFALRLGRHPRQVVTTTPRPLALLKRLMTDAACTVTRAASRANRANLSPAFFSSIVDRYEGTRLGRQELDAEILDDTPGALWTRNMLDRTLAGPPPPLVRVVVAVDPPAGGAGPGLSACGIIAAGLDGRGLLWVLEDCSIAASSPTVWARRVAAAFHRHRACRIVAEVNQGGEMVEAVLRQIMPDAPVRKVRAHRGKRLRAEPVAALYEQGRVRHAAAFPELEDQMCGFDGSPARASGASASPDRMDALVWALSDLVAHRPPAPRVRSVQLR